MCLTKLARLQRVGFVYFMTRQPYIYTMPEEFIKDSEVPAHWRLLALFNGFFISGKPFYATNEWISKQIGLKQWAISSGITKLEQMGKIHTEGKHSKRRIITSTAKLVLEDQPSVATLGNLVDEHLEPSDAPLHTSDSNSVIKYSAKAVFTIEPDTPKKNTKSEGLPYEKALRWAEVRTGRKFINRVKQYTALKKARAVGITGPQLTARWEELELKSFHEENGLDWCMVVSSFDRK